MEALIATFPDEKRKKKHPLGWEWFEYTFPNGYGASIIRGEHSYGGPEGKWELAVLKGGSLCYDTPITSDVIGWLDEETVREHLAAIEAL